MRIAPLSSMVVAILLLSAAAGAASSVAGAPLDTTTSDGLNVSVFYATNRKRREGEAPADTYGGERGEPSYGRCEVAFSPIPVIDQVAAKLPFYMPGETNEVRRVEGMEPDRFWEQLSAAAARTASGSVVLFVHGYNYGFARTCRMAAELERTLAGRAVVVMFSWPANGLPTDYVRDQADVEWSAPFLAEVIDSLGQRIGRDRVQLLAHSLGTRGLVLAMLRLRSDLGNHALSARLVLLAPDFDAQTFVELLPRLRSLTGGMTLYASENDTPLKVSRQLSGYPRLGEGGARLTLAEGMESIEVSGIGRYQILGHEYFYYHPLVVADLVELLSTGKTASERSGLLPRHREGVPYWEIRQPAAP